MHVIGDECFRLLSYVDTPEMSFCYGSGRADIGFDIAKVYSDLSVDLRDVSNHATATMVECCGANSGPKPGPKIPKEGSSKKPGKARSTLHSTPARDSTKTRKPPDGNAWSDRLVGWHKRRRVRTSAFPQAAS